MIKRLTAECAGTFWLVFAGCGFGLLSAGHAAGSGAPFGQPVAFGLALMTVSYLFRPISGAHFNPAVTVGLAVANRFPVRDLVPYMLAQIAGSVAAAILLHYIADAQPAFESAASNVGANGYGAHSPGHFRLRAALVIEVLATFAFVMVHLAAFSRPRPRLAAPVMVGVALIVAYLVAIPITGGSVNPARSTGPAFVTGAWALDELWLFWAAPLAAGGLAGLCYPAFFEQRARRSGLTLHDTPL